MKIKAPLFLLLFLVEIASAAEQSVMSHRLVKDINPGVGSSTPSYLTDMNGILYFAANDGVHGNELWRSDGTPAGTYMLKDIWPGTIGSNPIELTPMNGALYFTANNGVSGAELWRSDGTAGGTVLVKDIIPGSVGSRPIELTVMNSELFFVLNVYPVSSITGQLWKSNGTDTGTVMIKDTDSHAGSVPWILTSCRGMLFFKGYDDTHGWELWRSDGTSAGTYMIKDLAPGTANGSPYYFTMFGGDAYFLANDRELWKTDGTPTGTSMIFRRAMPYLAYMAEVNGTLFFGTTGWDNPRELYKSNGTPAGTGLVKLISNSDYSGFHHLLAFKGMLYFGICSYVSNNGLWRSDGTDAGTVQVKAFDWRYQSSGPVPMVIRDDTLFFAANDREQGVGIWKSDGTAAGTMLAADVAPGPTGSIPRDLTFSGDRLFFVAEDGTGQGKELWAIDLTSTVPVKLSTFHVD